MIDNTIDASSFTTVRLLAAVVTLFMLIQLGRQKDSINSQGSWLSGLILFIYAITVSYAYITLDTGVGALILFGAVQLTIVFLSILSGHKLHISEWAGVLIAFCGFVYLMLPDAKAPSWEGFVLMTISGTAWGIYTFLGRTSRYPLEDTAYNFFKTIPYIIILIIVTHEDIQYTSEGIIWAVLSGAVTSAIGYTIWYMTLQRLHQVQAAVFQLLVPIIASLGGFLFVSEPITFHLAVSSFIILGGILLVVLGRYSLLKRKA